MYIDELKISEKLKGILRENFIFTLSNFYSHAIEVFKKHFDLTADDWQSIISIFVNKKTKKTSITDSTLAAISREEGTDVKRVNALLINVFNEKYVVATIKKGKRLFDDYIYKSISRGVVFLDYDDAKRFAEKIRKINNSKIIEREITSAQETIYVVNAFSIQKGKCIMCIHNELDSEKILACFVENANYMNPRRAIKLAKKAVDRINRVYDYEIATMVTVICDEENSKITENTPNEPICKPFDELYISIEHYQNELKKLYVDEDGTPYTFGINHAIFDSMKHTLSSIEENIDECTEWLEQYQEDAGVTEDDITYRRGYVEGLRLAASVYVKCQGETYTVNVALIDQYDLFSRLGVDCSILNVSHVSGNVTINMMSFATLDEAFEIDIVFDEYFLICTDDLSHEQEDELTRMQMDFYASHKKNLELIRSPGTSKLTYVQSCF